MVDPSLALVAVAIVVSAALVSIPWGLAYAARGRAADAELSLARAERDAGLARADRAEQAARVAADAARAYLTALPPAAPGAGDREWLLRALEAATSALGAVDPGAPAASERPDAPGVV